MYEHHIASHIIQQYLGVLAVQVVLLSWIVPEVIKPAAVVVRVLVELAQVDAGLVDERAMKKGAQGYKGKGKGEFVRICLRFSVLSCEDKKRKSGKRLKEPGLVSCTSSEKATAPLSST